MSQVCVNHHAAFKTSQLLTYQLSPRNRFCHLFASHLRPLSPARPSPISSLRAAAPQVIKIQYTKSMRI